MKKIFNVAAIVLVCFALAAWGLTTVTGQRIINSTIDSTPIGNAVASTGRFLSLTANSISSGYLQAGNTPVTSPQGAYLGWNTSGGFGETDFLNSRGSGGGGWYFYNASTGGAFGAPVASIDGSGNFHGPSFVGSLNGNASSATTANSANTANYSTNAGAASTANSLTGPVYNCGATTPATGIQQNGNANCGAYPSSAAGNGWATLPGGIILEWGQTGNYDTGPVSVSLPHVLPNACLQATVGSVYTSATRISALVSCNNSSITIRNDGSGNSSFMVIGF